MSKLVISLLLVTLCATITLQQNTDTDGLPGTVGLFPWFVYIQQRNWFAESCGGTIIAPTWVVSSADCRNDWDLTVYRVFIGAVNWQFDSASSQVIETNQFYNHPLYVDSEGNRTNNIALLELPTEIQFSLNVQPISLPWEYTSDSFEGLGLWIVAAIEHFNDDGRNPNLRFNQVRSISNDECDDISPGLRNEPEMCTFVTASNPLQTPCKVESGIALARYSNETWIMVGSGTDKGCGDTVPTRWNRLTEHLTWITEVTGLTQE